MELGHTYDFNVIARDFAQKKSGEVVTAEDWNNLILALLASNKINSPQLANVADDLTAIIQAINALTVGAIPVDSITREQIAAGTLTADLFAVDSVNTEAIQDEAVVLEKCISGLFTQLLKGNVAYYANQGVTGTYVASSGTLYPEFVVNVAKEHNLLIIVCSNGVLIILRGLDFALWLGIKNNPLYAWQAFSPVVRDLTGAISGEDCYGIVGTKHYSTIYNLHFDETTPGQTKIAFILAWEGVDVNYRTYNFGNSIFAI